MSDKYGRGSTAIISPIYVRIGGTGVLADADPGTLIVDIIDPDDVVLITDDQPTTHPATGSYTYEWPIPGNADLGIYTARVNAIVNGVPVGPGEHQFEVVAAAEIGFVENAFATVAELEAMLGSEITNADGAELALLTATGAIRAAAKHRISHIGGETKKLHGNWSDRLFLPEPPVTDVESVHLRTHGSDEPVELTGFHWTRHGHLTRGGDLEPGLAWGGPDGEVTVVYSHGFNPVPGEIKGLCLQIAGRLYGGGSGVSSYTIGGFSEAFGTDGAGVQLTSDELAVCRRYWPIEA